jgi:tetratricopeptide (TPR) repeat protein
VLAGLGQGPAAERVLAHAVDISRAKQFVDSAGALAYCDLIAARLGRGEDVTALLAEARRLYPRNWVALWLQARVFIAAGSFDEAIGAFDQLLAVDVAGLPDEGPSYDERLFGEFAHDGRGLCLFRLGRYREAAAAYAEAGRCHPASRAYSVKAELALARSRRAAAVSVTSTET